MVHYENRMVPVKKINNSIVSLNSYYGKLFISRGTHKRNDLGFWFQNKLHAMYDTDKSLKDVISLPVVSYEANVPKDYGMIGRYIKGFKYKNIVFNFDYISRASALGIEDLSIEKKSVLVGSIKGTPVMMDFNNKIYMLDKDNTQLGTIFELLGIDISKAPVEYCNAKVYKKQIPVAVLLSYYLGYTSLLKLLKTKYTIVDTGTRAPISDGQFKIIFKDSTYIVDRDYGVSDLVLGGFINISKHTKLITVDNLNSKSKYASLFVAMSYPVLYINEIKLMENMFIDPVTKQVLELFKLPITFPGIIFKAVDMLQDDNYKHPNDIEGSILKGYERISGIMYLEIVRALRTNINKSHFSKSKISINPYVVLNKINEDSTTVLIEDLNPIASLKQLEDVTYLGSHGRKIETMSAGTRIMHPSEIGVISEAVKDSGDVGVSTYLTSVPNINTTRGDTGKFSKEDGWANKLSTSAMISPFGTTDDPKRLNFTNIMNAHVIPMSHMTAPYVRTGGESVVAVKSSSKFVVSAEEDGVVVTSTPTSIVVLYKTLGRKKYSIKEWTTKEASDITYTHKMLPNLKKGAKFIKDDTLVYDKSFFEPDVFNNNRVIIKLGSTLNVALMESPETYEDSASISSKMATKMGTIVTKVRSVIVNSADKILDSVVVGDKVEPKQPLLAIVNKELNSISELDDTALAILKELKMLSPKSRSRGVIQKIVVYYNSEYKNLTASIKKLVDISDKELLSSDGHTGQVDSSYSINGKPLAVDEVEIKYYIKTKVSMGTGDKMVLGNQLKATIGSVYLDEIVSEDGTSIDGLFSTQSIEARIVNSAALIGTTSKLLEVLSNKVTDDYFK